MRISSGEKLDLWIEKSWFIDAIDRNRCSNGSTKTKHKRLHVLKPPEFHKIIAHIGDQRKSLDQFLGINLLVVSYRLEENAY